MRIGIDLPREDAEGRVLDAAGVMERSKMVEAAGFEGIWIGDGSYFRGRYTEVDPLMWALLAVAATDQIEVGFTVLQVPLREPVDLAQRLMTLHALARGRFTAGVGAGSTDQGSFSAVGVPYAERFSIFHAAMAKIRRLLDGEEVDGTQLPQWADTEGGPHFVLGAWHSDLSLRRAVREYDGWMSSSGSTSPKVMAEGIRKYRDLGGTRAMTTTCRIDLTAPAVPLADDAPFTLMCGASEAADRLHLLAEMGFDDVCLRFVDHAYRDGLTGVANFTAEDLATIRSLYPPDPTLPYGG